MRLGVYSRVMFVMQISVRHMRVFRRPLFSGRDVSRSMEVAIRRVEVMDMQPASVLRWPIMRITHVSSKRSRSRIASGFSK
jgi:hypothetical protein